MGSRWGQARHRHHQRKALSSAQAVDHRPSWSSSPSRMRWLERHSQHFDHSRRDGRREQRGRHRAAVGRNSHRHPHRLDGAGERRCEPLRARDRPHEHRQASSGAAAREQLQCREQQPGDGHHDRASRPCWRSLAVRPGEREGASIRLPRRGRTDDRARASSPAVTSSSAACRPPTASRLRRSPAA